MFLQQLALLDGFDLAAMGPGSADFIHTVTECAKLAFADREAWYGDPRYADVPLAGLLSPRVRGASAADWWARTPRAELVPGRARRRRAAAAGVRGRRVRPLRPGAADAACGRTAAIAATARGSRWPRPTGVSAPELGLGDTCHLDVADSFGNLVSATPSGGWLQSSPVIPGLGFCLGTRGADVHRLPRAWPAPWRRAGGRAPRCRPAWRCATASPTWRSAPPAATSRISGRSGSSSTTCCSA